jgi:anti-sigma factor RsiW
MSPEPVEFPTGCVDDEVLELYVLRRLPPKDEHQIDLHIMECDDCQSRLRVAEERLDLLKQALREIKANSTSALVLVDLDGITGDGEH